MIKRYFLNLFLLFTLVIVLAACGSGNDNENDSWKEEANLDANESEEDLYDKAKDEGEVVIYSMSSSWESTKDYFEEEFPEIEVKGAKLHGPDLLTRLGKEQEGGKYEADVVLVKEIHGQVLEEFVNTGMLHGYTPARLMKNLSPPYDEKDYIVPWVAMRSIFYNTDAYDEHPIENWWDLTTEEWEGKVMINDPLASSDTAAVFLLLYKNLTYLPSPTKKDLEKS